MEWDNERWPNFIPEEFTCKCPNACEFKDWHQMDIALIDFMQNRRDQLSRAIIVTSALRCSEHNFDIGGAVNSRHKEGKAVDYTYATINVEKEAAWLQQIYKWQGGIYAYVGRGFVHVDTDTMPSAKGPRQQIVIGHHFRPIPKGDWPC